MLHFAQRPITGKGGALGLPHRAEAELEQVSRPRSLELQCIPLAALLRVSTGVPLGEAAAFGGRCPSSLPRVIHVWGYQSSAVCVSSLCIQGSPVPRIPCLGGRPLLCSAFSSSTPGWGARYLPRQVIAFWANTDLQKFSSVNLARNVLHTWWTWWPFG